MQRGLLHTVFIKSAGRNYMDRTSNEGWCFLTGYDKTFNRLILYIQNRRYVYSCSPYIHDQFVWKYGRNRGQAVAYIKKQGVLVEGGK